MIGKIVKTEDVRTKADGRNRYTKVTWDRSTADLGAHQSGVPLVGLPHIDQPRSSKLPGILGKVGDTVEVTVRVIPRTP